MADEPEDIYPDHIVAEYGTGPLDECFGCDSPTYRWVHAMTSYPLCPICMTTAQREQGLLDDDPPCEGCGEPGRRAHEHASFEVCDVCGRRTFNPDDDGNKP